MIGIYVYTVKATDHMSRSGPSTFILTIARFSQLQEEGNFERPFAWNSALFRGSIKSLRKPKLLEDSFDRTCLYRDQHWG